MSWYLDDAPHVRFSVWDESGVALAAISLEEAEARRLTVFLARAARTPPSLRQRLASRIAG